MKDAFMGFRLGEAVLRTCFHYGPIAMNESDNYEARANLMWASTNAISGTTKFGTDVGWSCHPMEHELSAYYDITHGVGPEKLELMAQNCAPKLANAFVPLTKEDVLAIFRDCL